MNVPDIAWRIPIHWTKNAAVVAEGAGFRCEIEVHPNSLGELCSWAQSKGCVFAGLIVEQLQQWVVRYVFCPIESEARALGAQWIHLLITQPLTENMLPSITSVVPAADWHEREAEDQFGLIFEGHPRLGDFVFHNDAWGENVNSMRREFDPRISAAPRKASAQWRPQRLLRAEGAFAMPVGPVYSGISESAHFLLETVGEDVIRAAPRFYYKHRAVEKLAEGRSADDVLLLAERFNGISAFAHGLAFVQALERTCDLQIPPRAQVLRTILAELERLRHHAGFIHDICESTALVVAASQAAILEEELLRLCGALTGHRYLFGLLARGGLTRDFDEPEIASAVLRAADVVHRLTLLEKNLTRTSSFLDRLEEVGVVTHEQALSYGVVGPLARACGVPRDLRKITPYAAYGRCDFDVAQETEGDGYARLRVLFTETRQSLRVIEQAVRFLPGGAVMPPEVPLAAGAALGWTEAPLGAAFHWVRIDDGGRVSRYRIIPPSFVNWHAFHLAVEHFAYQDFPIILATFGLSVAENDR